MIGQGRRFDGGVDQAQVVMVLGLGGDMSGASDVTGARYEFGDKELAVYGEKELQTLERMLPLQPGREALNFMALSVMSTVTGVAAGVLACIATGIGSGFTVSVTVAGLELPPGPDEV